uniref:Uncharacterized protein n=1 Tax=Globodera pallida TaxID=36090 RepID=A0A183CFW7_GLOPA
MSEHPREAQRHLQKICVADDIWFGIFALFGRAELGLELALTCYGDLLKPSIPSTRCVAPPPTFFPPEFVMSPSPRRHCVAGASFKIAN